MFVVSDMTAVLAVFLLLTAKPSLQSWLWFLSEVLHVRVSAAARSTGMSLGGLMPIPFALMCVVSLVLGLVAIVSRGVF